jgi:hypothetical protein
MKKQISFKQIPIGVGIIAAFYIFGAFMLLASIYFNPLGTSQAIDRAYAGSGVRPNQGVALGIFADDRLFALPVGRKPGNGRVELPVDRKSSTASIFR